MRGARAGSPGRLTKRPDFVAAASGRRFHTERMTVQGRLRPDRAVETGEALLRVGLTVTKRVGHATERNRIKRRLRAAVLEAGVAPPDMPVDVVVIARRDILAADYGRLVEDLGRALKVVTKPKPPRPPAPESGGRRAPADA